MPVRQEGAEPPRLSWPPPIVTPTSAQPSSGPRKWYGTFGPILATGEGGVVGIMTGVLCY